MSNRKQIKQDQIIASFDYNTLDPKQRIVVQQRTGEIKERLQRSAQDIWEVGQRLTEVRNCLRYGQFDVWLKAEFGWSRRTAYNFINVYETFQERANLAQVNIATSALYLLASPSTPPEIRNKFLNRAQAGERVTHKELSHVLKQKSSSSQDVSPQSQPITPEIVKVIPKSSELLEPFSSTLPNTGSSPLIPSVPVSEIPTIQMGWHHLSDQHWLFHGDTASNAFAQNLPEAAFALAITSNDWDHDWLIDQARTVTILAEADLQHGMVENLLLLFSKPKDVVIFPWLPRPDIISIAYHLDRHVYAGDASLSRCREAIAYAGLRPKPTQVL